MPRQAADLEEALNKKGGLTLSQLANYDDLITDALVDRVYFWSSIRKLKATYHAARGVREEDICSMLQQHVIVKKEPAEAHKRILQLPGMQKFYRALRTDDEKEHFERHLRKYINIYLPDCPFDVGTTNRYTITTHEAAIFARRYIRRGEPIKYLTGIQVEMNEQEEKELSSRTDFSIVLSSRRKRPSLFLGPARFANHDCDSNARLNTNGPHGIHIVACKDIMPGDEITVTYGDDYFGDDNCECLCGTCESWQRNGWDPRGPLLRDDSSDEEAEAEDEPKQRSTSRAQASARPPPRRTHAGPLLVNEGGEEVPRKRGPGRPRKRRRGEESSNSSERLGKRVRKEDQDDALCDGEDIDKQRDGGGRVLRKANSQPASLDEVQVQPFLHGLGNGESCDSVLEKIKRMLEGIGERMRAGQGSSPEGECITVASDLQRARTGAPRQQEEIRERDGLELTDGTEWPRDSAGRFTPRDLPRSSPTQGDSSTLSYARAFSRSPERTPPATETPRRHAISAASVTPKARLPTIKKERSFSSLRNVTNADETRPDVYSVPDSPAPQQPNHCKRKRAEQTLGPDIYDFPANEPVAPAPAPAPAVQEPPPKRKRGRPRKYPRPEDVVATAAGDSSAESTSSSSNGTDSASNGSLASSATSIETFTAGNIAQDICNMLTQDVERGADLEDDDAIKVEEASSGELTPKRGRPATRKSLRSGAAERSVAPVCSIEVQETKGDAEEDEDEKRGDPRTPGDYYLCSALLVTPHHRWVQCRNCDKHFVQTEAFQTRIACPKCERHSKLYGYYWPKTDKEGKHDTEERVLDHRSIHRFIEPEEERTERKGRKTLLLEKARFEEEQSVSRQESEDSERVGERRLRGSPRGGSRRGLRQTM